MFSMTGSTMKQAISPLSSTRSSASGSLNGTTFVASTMWRATPAELASEIGASAGPAWSTGGFIEIITSSWWP